MALDFDLYKKLRDFDFHIFGSFEKGITGLFGPSGAGKTTFFNLLSGLDKPTEGYVRLNDRLIVNSEKRFHLPVHKRKIACVFQDKLLFPHMTVKQNLLFGLGDEKNRKLNFDDVVDFLSLNSLLQCKPSELSGGEQQRTAIGRAILSSPEMLLLDEPFNAIDYNMRQSILHTVRDLQTLLDIPILVISHDMADLKFLTNQIFLISKGKIRDYDCYFEEVQSLHAL